jgi:aflatoxin B1 aldehyde reductase
MSLIGGVMWIAVVHNNMWYLHGPDRTTPYIDTMREVNELHKQGLFDRFGLSNYMAWEVAQICEICEAPGWIKPIVYQGIYNAMNRTVEAELFPCLRHYKMGYYAYNPLGGGFFAGNFKKDAEVEKGSRFDPEKRQGSMYRGKYWNEVETKDSCHLPAFMYFPAGFIHLPTGESHLQMSHSSRSL